jgi:hypothetical protein
VVGVASFVAASALGGCFDRREGAVAAFSFVLASPGRKGAKAWQLTTRWFLAGLDSGG